jgi:uncharacterized protein YjbJ (UPF0337 family)
VESVKATAIEAVDTVKDDASAAVDNIQNQNRA